MIDYKEPTYNKETYFYPKWAITLGEYTKDLGISLQNIYLDQYKFGGLLQTCTRTLVRDILSYKLCPCFQDCAFSVDKIGCN